MYRGMKSIRPYNSKILFPAHLVKCTCWCQSRVSRTPGREPRSWSTCRSPLKGRFDGCPSEREEGAVGALGAGPGPASIPENAGA